MNDSHSSQKEALSFVLFRKMMVDVKVLANSLQFKLIINRTEKFLHSFAFFSHPQSKIHNRNETCKFSMSILYLEYFCLCMIYQVGTIWINLVKIKKWKIVAYSFEFI